jgi:hypothetical protein
MAMRATGLLVVVACALGGCATVTRGTTEQVQIVSSPPGAAVAASTGNSCTTPCTMEVSRKSEFTLTVTKDGYEPATISVTTRLSGTGAAGFAGNILAGGIVGMAADAATGATLEHVPNPVSVTLQPLKTVPASRLRKLKAGPVAPTS